MLLLQFYYSDRVLALVCLIFTFTETKEIQLVSLTQTALELHNGTGSTDQYWFCTSFGILAKVLTSVNYSCLDLWCVAGGLSMNVLNSILENVLALSPFIATINVIKLICFNKSSDKSSYLRSHHQFNTSVC